MDISSFFLHYFFMAAVLACFIFSHCSCSKADLRVDYIKEGDKDATFGVHVDFTTVGEEINSPPTVNSVIKKSIYKF